MATEEMEKKIKENEDLQNKLESALSNQEAQREAYQVKPGRERERDKFVCSDRR